MIKDSLCERMVKMLSNSPIPLYIHQRLCEEFPPQKNWTLKIQTCIGDSVAWSITVSRSCPPSATWVSSSTKQLTYRQMSAITRPSSSMVFYSYFICLHLFKSVYTILQIVIRLTVPLYIILRFCHSVPSRGLVSMFMCSESNLWTHFTRILSQIMQQQKIKTYISEFYCQLGQVVIKV